VSPSGEDEASRWFVVTMMSGIPVRGKVERCLGFARVGDWALGTHSVALYGSINSVAGGLR
jgi:hypothetical protein